MHGFEKDEVLKPKDFKHWIRTSHPALSMADQGINALVKTKIVRKSGYEVRIHCIHLNNNIRISRQG